jgi:hypothetical protein
MKYLHKYVVDGTPIFVLKDSASKPSGTYSMKQEDWRGRALGRFGTVVGQLENLKFSKKEEDVSEEPGQEEVVEKKSCVSKIVRDVVSKIKE